MEININQTHWWFRIATAFERFTSLPISRFFSPSPSYDIRAMEFWPLVGWLSGGIAALTILLLEPLIGLPIAVGIAIALRSAFTGMRNEQGLAALASALVNKKRGDDGLRHMEKNEFDVPGATITVIVWAALWWALSTMDGMSAAITIIAADTYSRMVSGQSIQMMPCATAREDYGTTPPYLKLGVISGIIYFIIGMAPMLILLWIGRNAVRWDIVIFTPCLVMYFLYLLVWRRFGGYTDKTIAAMQALAEITVCISIALMI